jgi:hypothetical protein
MNIMTDKRKAASLNPVFMLPEEDEPNNISGSDQAVDEAHASEKEADSPMKATDRLNSALTFGESNSSISKPDLPVLVTGATWLPQVVTNLKQKVQQADWIPSDDKKRNTHIERCHPIISDNIKFLSHLYCKRQSEIARAALFLGINLLWTLNQIKEIKDIRMIVHTLSDDQEDREFFSSAKFDGLESAYAKPLHIEFFERDAKQCDGLASELGLNPGIVRQLALMAGLINAREIPQRDRDRMVGILKKFRQWLERRVKKAQDIKRIVQERQSSCTLPAENRPTSWNDVIEDK